MKIQVNFDLIKKINDANTGFSLVRPTEKTFIYTVASIPLAFIFDAFFPTFEIPSAILNVFLIQSGIQVSVELLCSRLTRTLSIIELQELAQILRDINVNTDYELLMQSYAYHTDYEFNFSKDSLIPEVEQKKYIMVPVYDNGEEKELSLVQEHVIGSKKYSLSIGEPKKVRKLVPSMA